MRIRVDHDKCFGYARCTETAPNTFTLDEGGQSVAGEQRDDDEAIQEAAWACPVQAIELAANEAHQRS